MLKLVVYDLDGTLVDSRADLCDAVNATLTALKLEPLISSQVLSFVGEGAELLMRRSLRAATRRDDGDDLFLKQAMPLWTREYQKRLVAKTKLYPGIVDLIKKPPTRRAVLTNKPGGFAREILERLGVAPFFNKVVGGDEAPRKPDPRGLVALCKELEAQPSETLYVGDSTIDISTAKAAGVPVCAVSWGLTDARDLRNAEPDFLCASAAEVIALLTKH
ncbi:MAG: HAD-IA family hydrolase [Deltaproteobacteria bacterium]|nr:HAD-IA family hydrolase [Deltaproteobacteria bacterium]